MIDNALGQQLHCRATTGQPLSAEERAQLEAWYKKLDDEEAAMLAKNAPPLLPLLEEVRESVDKMWSQIAAMTPKIVQLRRENAKLRRENALLEEQLRHQVGSKAA